MRPILPSVLILALFLASAVYGISFPKPSGYVNDFANIFSSEEKARLESMLAEIERNTTVEIAIATVKNLEGLGIEDYSLQLAESWGIGKKSKDNGLLILVALEERKYRFEVGYGLEGVLNDARVGRIGREILVPSFKQGKYGSGLVMAVEEIMHILEGKEEAVAEKPVVPIHFGWIFIADFVFLIFWLAWVAKQKTKIKQWLYGSLGSIAPPLIVFFIFGVILAGILLIFNIFLLLAGFLSWISRGRKHGTFFGAYGGGFRTSGYGGSGGFGGFGGGGFGGGGSSGGW